MTLSKTMIFHYAECCHYAECRVLFIIMLNVIMLNVVMLSVIMLSAVVPVGRTKTSANRLKCFRVSVV
jgi:hypothetical protein